MVTKYKCAPSGKAIDIYKKNGVVGLYDAINKGTLASISDDRKKMRLELLKVDYDYEIDIAEGQKQTSGSKPNFLTNFK